MNLTVLISIPFFVFLCGAQLAMNHAYEKRDITILSIFTSILCGLNAVEKLGRAISEVEIIRTERIALIFASLMWISAMFLHAYIFIKGIKCRKE